MSDDDQYRSVVAEMFAMSGDEIMGAAISSNEPPARFLDSLKAGEPIVDVYAYDNRINGKVQLYVAVGVELAEGELVFASDPTAGCTAFRRKTAERTVFEEAREFLGPELLAMAKVRIRYRTQGAVEDTTC
ncbi:hypothetical protein [Actinoallomurus sp. NPDC052274]|uniref:hypothetical protein n=1 Tax=Actinoallomurus sp. NPDC052274 TaxID=3155420 RepID=UPI00344829EA